VAWSEQIFSAGRAASTILARRDSSTYGKMLDCWPKDRPNRSTGRPFPQKKYQWNSALCKMENGKELWKKMTKARRASRKGAKRELLREGDYQGRPRSSSTIGAQEKLSRLPYKKTGANESKKTNREGKLTVFQQPRSTEQSLSEGTEIDCQGRGRWRRTHFRRRRN